MRASLAVTRPGDRSWQWHFVSPMLNGGGGTLPWPQIPSDIHTTTCRLAIVWSVPEATVVHMPDGYDAIVRTRYRSEARPRR